MTTRWCGLRSVFHHEKYNILCRKTKKTPSQSQRSLRNLY